MKIKYVDCVGIQKPSFGRVDTTEGLLVDSEYSSQLRGLGILSAESLHSFAKADPTYTQKIFDMSNDEFETALTTLATKLNENALEFMQIENAKPKDYATGVPLPETFAIPKDTDIEK